MTELILAGGEKKFDVVAGKLRAEMMTRIAELQKKEPMSTTDKRELDILNLRLALLAEIKKEAEAEGLVAALRRVVAEKEKLAMNDKVMLNFEAGAFTVADMLAAYRYMIGDAERFERE